MANNYPERLGMALIINIPAPSLFAFGWNLVKYIFDDNIRNKFIFVTQSNWKDKLLEYIDEADLPAYLGGKLYDPDEFCSNSLGIGGVVPSELYKDTSDFITIQIPARTNHFVDILVGISNSIISWEFTIASHDLKFSIQYHPTNDQNDDKKKRESVTTLFKETKFEAQLESTTGKLVAQKTGTYTLVFDNSFSWMRSKTISLRYSLDFPSEIQVLEQEQDKIKE